MFENVVKYYISLSGTAAPSAKVVIVYYCEQQQKLLLVNLFPIQITPSTFHFSQSYSQHRVTTTTQAKMSTPSVLSKRVYLEGSPSQAIAYCYILTLLPEVLAYYHILLSYYIDQVASSQSVFDVYMRKTVSSSRHHFKVST